MSLVSEAERFVVPLSHVWKSNVGKVYFLFEEDKKMCAVKGDGTLETLRFTPFSMSAVSIARIRVNEETETPVSFCS